MTGCVIDHLVVTSPDLETGEKYLYESLGVHPQPGGEHEKMGTHNRLLSLGDSTYLEVIAINPDAPSPGMSRWFGLDHLKPSSPPALTTWVARTENMEPSLGRSLEPVGNVHTMARGDLNWLITIPEDGIPPLGGVVPALIEWQSERHPAGQLEDAGLTLIDLAIYHPDSERVSAQLEALGFQGPVSVYPLENLSAPYLQAVIDTPTGIKQLKLNGS